MASSKSSPFPWGMPSRTSIRTTFASSLEEIQWAAVAPTLPAPTMVTFLRMKKSSRRNVSAGGRALAPVHHVINDVCGKFAGFHLSRARHQPLEVIGDELLLNGCFH